MPCLLLRRVQGQCQNEILRGYRPRTYRLQMRSFPIRRGSKFLMVFTSFGFLKIFSIPYKIDRLCQDFSKPTSTFDAIMKLLLSRAKHLTRIGKIPGAAKPQQPKKDGAISCLNNGKIKDLINGDCTSTIQIILQQFYLLSATFIGFYKTSRNRGNGSGDVATINIYPDR